MYKQDDRHDWFGDVAESFVCYRFAKAGFEVFGASKWGADCVIRHPFNDKYYRVEVKGADNKKRPAAKYSKIKDKAELLARVSLEGEKLVLKLCWVKDMSSSRNDKFFTPEELFKKLGQNGGAK